MANHVRRQVREAIGTAVTGLATTGSNVFQSRVYPTKKSSLPCLLIYTSSEEADVETVHAPALIRRATEIRVEGVASETADLDDKLDLIAKEVETALASGVTIGGKLVPLAYLGCDIVFDGEGEKPVGKLSMRYQAQLYNLANAPDTLS